MRVRIRGDAALLEALRREGAGWVADGEGGLHELGARAVELAALGL